MVLNFYWINRMEFKSAFVRIFLNYDNVLMSILVFLLSRWLLFFYRTIVPKFLFQLFQVIWLIDFVWNSFQTSCNESFRQASWIPLSALNYYHSSIVYYSFSNIIPFLEIYFKLTLSNTPIGFKISHWLSYSKKTLLIN